MAASLSVAFNRKFSSLDVQDIFGFDYVDGPVFTANTSETLLASITIPAGMLTERLSIIVHGVLKYTTWNSYACNCRGELKIYVNGTEVKSRIIGMSQYTCGNALTGYVGRTIFYSTTDLDFTSDITVEVKGLILNGVNQGYGIGFDSIIIGGK